MSRSIWATLGIPQTRDRDVVRRAYAARLRETNPEDDPQGFIELRAAYDAAMARARAPEPAYTAPPAEALDEAPPPRDEPVPEADEPDDEPDPVEPPDAEFAELRARADRLAASLDDTRWGADPAALAALIAAPAFERIAVRADVEEWLARLIASNVPRSDPLVRPAIAALGWAATARSDPAVDAVLQRAAELDAEAAAVAAPRGFFNRVSEMSFGGWRPWLFGGILLVQALRLVFGGSDDRVDTNPLPTPPTAAEAMAGPPGPRAAIPIKPARWLGPSAVTGGIASTAAELIVATNVMVTADGVIGSCEPDGYYPSGLGAATCRLLQANARFRPALDRHGTPVIHFYRQSVRWRAVPGQPQSFAPVLADPSPGPAPVPAAEATRRGPECPREPAAQPGVVRRPVACSSSQRWLSFRDFPEAELLAAGTRTLTARYDVGEDGFIGNCRLDPGSGVAPVDAKVCKLLTRRVHYLPGRDASGRATRWNYTYSWGWTVTPGQAAVSIPPIPPSDFKAGASDAPLTADCAPQPGGDAVLLPAVPRPGCP